MMELNLTASNFVISGFSSGAYMTTNLFAMFNDNINGTGIHSGSGPCATQGIACTNRSQQVMEYPTDGYRNKPTFFYSGTKDNIVLHNWTTIPSDYYENLNANVGRLWVDSFVHIFPNSLPPHEQYNPPLACHIRNENYSAVQNCGLNLAKASLEHIYGHVEMRYFDYQEFGHLYSIDQTPF